MMNLIMHLKDGTKQEYSLQDSVFAVKLNTNNVSTIEDFVASETPVFVLQICSLADLKFADKQLFYGIYSKIYSLIKTDSIVKLELLLPESDEVVFNTEMLDIKPMSVSITDELGKKNLYDNTTISINLLFQ